MVQRRRWYSANKNSQTRKTLSGATAPIANQYRFRVWARAITATQMTPKTRLVPRSGWRNMSAIGKRAISNETIKLPNSRIAGPREATNDERASNVAILANSDGWTVVNPR